MYLSLIPFPPFQMFLVRKEGNANNMVLAVRMPVQSEAPGVLEYNIKEEKSSKFFTVFSLTLVVIQNPLVNTSIYVVLPAVLSLFLWWAADLDSTV